MTSKFVIVGTDTGIGKTIFAAALTHALGACYWKPIQSGLTEETDSETVARLGAIAPHRIIPEAWKLNTPASPHFAAQLDHVTIDPNKLDPSSLPSPVIIEGTGGLCVPLTENCLFIDVFAKWQIPTILCARTTLGTINHTLLSLEAMRQRSIPICGVVFIGEEERETQTIIAKLGKVRILGRLPWLHTLTSDTLQQAFKQQFPLSLFQAVNP